MEEQKDKKNNCLPKDKPEGKTGISMIILMLTKHTYCTHKK